MERKHIFSRNRVAVLLGVVLAVGCVGVASAVVFADGADDQTAAGSQSAKGLDTWFSVTQTGEPASPKQLETLRATRGGGSAPAMPSIRSARLATTADGAQAIVTADDSTICLFPGNGGGCWAAPDPSRVAAAPVLVTGVGQETRVHETRFVALAADGIDEILVGVEGGSNVRVPVNDNVAVATVPGRVLTWEWRDPVAGERRTEASP